jgi:hypothetical protein
LIGEASTLVSTYAPVMVKNGDVFKHEWGELGLMLGRVSVARVSSSGE